jgi:hypothetical protein
MESGLATMSGAPSPGGVVGAAATVEEDDEKEYEEVLGEELDEAE